MVRQDLDIETRQTDVDSEVAKGKTDYVHFHMQIPLQNLQTDSTAARSDEHGQSRSRIFFPPCSTPPPETGCHNSLANNVAPQSQ